MLTIEKLRVRVGGREVLHDIDLRINDGETHVLMGPNGSGKSTLLMTIMGFGNYEVTGGRITFKGEDITHLPIHERAELGIGMLFQRPPTIAGLKLGKLLTAVAGGKTGDIPAHARLVNMEGFLERDINQGFSGGEIKRSEVLQLMVQRPDFVMLDEPESGVDLENISLMGESIAKLLQKDQHIVNRQKSGLIITHTGYILNYLEADFGHVMIDGTIRCHGNPREILSVIKEKGYRECLACQQI
ncbi:ABC transporter ATP-binding protein [Methanofollis fontis]|uniref:ABC transporter ATP-binding protein n=1 Tax=Methanofollis fontis TaxID=2052832 RepID=A0A483CVI4_9EURY|nr:ABC transporter ATP-binding protein [Methanofollis fontis]TAJ45666.1 ABC transporter ATP-binding protein [Methanofollis fontis]